MLKKNRKDECFLFVEETMNLLLLLETSPCNACIQDAKLQQHPFAHYLANMRICLPDNLATVLNRCTFDI